MDRPDAASRPNRNVARGEATRGQLIAIATRIFAERGYEDTSIEAVLREAGVSRGSLYHHFPSKEALFEAVAEEVETSVGAQTVTAASGAQGSVEALRAGFLAWIRLAGDPVVQRILLIDGPSVLGWERWRAMEEHHALGLVRAGLQIIADEGKTRPELVGTLAHVLLASVNEVALLVARSDDKEAAMQAGAEAIDELLQRLFYLPARWPARADRHSSWPTRSPGKHGMSGCSCSGHPVQNLADQVHRGVRVQEREPGHGLAFPG
jgi:AcrR family transcriptional regulator